MRNTYVRLQCGGQIPYIFWFFLLFILFGCPDAQPRICFKSEIRYSPATSSPAVSSLLLAAHCRFWVPQRQESVTWFENNFGHPCFSFYLCGGNLQFVRVMLLLSKEYLFPLRGMGGEFFHCRSASSSSDNIVKTVATNKLNVNNVKRKIKFCQPIARGDDLDSNTFRVMINSYQEVSGYFLNA